MCLAIPGKVLAINGTDALVDFDGVQRNVVIALCEGVDIGSYIIVHAGYAIETVDEKEAEESLKLWREAIEDTEISKEDII
ncbi:MAG: HypC/HybG/HupF family hydrogenase formation chaperone [Candidatus Lokiarchaeota archaeon]|nr:HypC/HybG/HupF family hydrogenase formation chaperone [Candidatus Lokiarchaeota archaeon]